MCALKGIQILASNAKCTYLRESGNSPISYYPWGARYHHDKRDAHGSSCTQEVSEAVMCGTSTSERGTTA